VSRKRRRLDAEKAADAVLGSCYHEQPNTNESSSWNVGPTIKQHPMSVVYTSKEAITYHNKELPQLHRSLRQFFCMCHLEA